MIHTLLIGSTFQTDFVARGPGLPGTALILAPESLVPQIALHLGQTGMVVPSPKEETQTMTYMESPEVRGQGDLEG